MASKQKKMGRDHCSTSKKRLIFLYLRCSSLFLMFEEKSFGEGKFTIGYSYFKTNSDQDDYIGGYASPTYEAENHGWMCTIGDIINNLVATNLKIEFFNEHTWYMCGIGDASDISEIQNLFGKIPMMFSLKAHY